MDVVGKRIMDVGTVRKLKDSEGWQCLNGCGCFVHEDAHIAITCSSKQSFIGRCMEDVHD